MINLPTYQELREDSDLSRQVLLCIQSHTVINSPYYLHAHRMLMLHQAYQASLNYLYDHECPLYSFDQWAKQHNVLYQPLVLDMDVAYSFYRTFADKTMAFDEFCDRANILLESSRQYGPYMLEYNFTKAESDLEAAIEDLILRMELYIDHLRELSAIDYLYEHYEFQEWTKEQIQLCKEYIDYLKDCLRRRELPMPFSEFIRFKKEIELPHVPEWHMERENVPKLRHSRYTADNDYSSSSYDDFEYDL